MKKILSFISVFVLLSTTLSCQIATANNDFEITATSSKNSIKLKWSKVKGAKHYKIYRKTRNKKYKLIKKTVKRTFIDKKLKTNKKYFYKVTAFKKNKKGKFYGFKSSTKSIKTYRRVVDESYGAPNYPNFITNHSIKRKITSRYADLGKKFNKFYISQDAPDFEITDYKDGVCINRYIGDEQVVEIPETIGGKPVIKLGMYCVRTTYIGIDYIYYSFDYSCPFMNQELCDELCDDEVVYNDELDCYECDLGEEWIMWDGIKKINKVDKIIIPKNVKYIGNLDSYTVTFEVDEENPRFSSVDGSLCSKDGKKLYRYNGNNETVKILADITTVYNKSLPKIFENCEVDENNKVYSSVNGSLLSKDGKELIIAKYANKYKVPKCVEKIKAGAFKERYISKVLIGKNVKKIDKKVFDELYEYSSFYYHPVKFTVDKDNKYFSSKKGSLYNKDGSILLYEPKYN